MDGLALEVGGQQGGGGGGGEGQITPTGQIKRVRFDDFQAPNLRLERGSVAEGSHLVAAKWIAAADAVLIVAGAGLSAREENVYLVEQDFEKAYGAKGKSGYQVLTSYLDHALGEESEEENEEQRENLILLLRMMQNQRFELPPTSGYETLLSLVENKSHFVLTSNVDGAFVRSGFDPALVYTPQGDLGHYQCLKRCKEDAVFPSQPMLETLFQNSSDAELLEKVNLALPRCPHCNGPIFWNVRANENFLHTMYDEARDRFASWLDDAIEQKLRLCIIEVGCGFNTPAVTRYMSEAIAREMEHSCLIRVNPIDFHIPGDIIRALPLPDTFNVLEKVKTALDTLPSEELNQLALGPERRLLSERRARANTKEFDLLRKAFGHFDWRLFLENLR